MDLGALFDTLLVTPMMDGLVWLARLTGGGGLAIMLFTVLIRLLMLPLSIYQTKSQKAMMALQPELKAAQKKFGKDRERMTQETMRLYREHGVNPASGCLPLLLQMPVFIGLYWALINLNVDPEQEGSRGQPAFREPFLWLPSLAHPDAFPIPLIAGLALPGPLPLFMAGSQYLMSKMMQMPSADPQTQSMNRMMTIFMPLMLLYFGITFPSGLVLYWAASNVFSIVQQGFTTGWGPLLPSPAAAEAEVAVNPANGNGRDVGGAPEERSRAAKLATRGSKRKRRGKR